MMDFWILNTSICHILSLIIQRRYWPFNFSSDCGNAKSEN